MKTSNPAISVRIERVPNPSGGGKQMPCLAVYQDGEKRPIAVLLLRDLLVDTMQSGGFSHCGRAVLLYAEGLAGSIPKNGPSDTEVLITLSKERCRRMRKQLAKYNDGGDTVEEAMEVQIGLSKYMNRHRTDVQWQKNVWGAKKK